jgi:two-component system, NtrC family, sensor kinase
MKLAFKFLLSSLLGILCVVAGSTAIEFRRELDLFDRDLQRDHRVFARSLAPAFAMTWEHEGRTAALALLDRVNMSEGFLQSRWLPAGSSEVPVGAPRAEDGLIQTVDPASRDPEILTFVPVDAGGLPGVIEIRESTHPRRHYVTESVVRAVLGGLGLFLWCAVCSLVLGFFFIVRPVRALVEHARSIGAGRFYSRSKPRSDELGQLGAEMNHMAELLEQSRLKLSEETNGRLQALNQLRHADRLATAGKLSSGIAHELGTPLSVVLGRAKIIRTNLAVPEEARRNAQIVEEQVVRMTRIIRHLMDFARAGESNRAQLCVRDLTQRVQTLLAPLAEKQGARLVLDAVIEDARLDADAEQLEQVLTNLIMNALQALRGPGLVTLRVDAKRTRGPGEATADDYVLIQVQDNGPGMPTQVVARVFEPFFTTKAIGEGTGLGLSVAYGIIEEHGGFLSVESSPGQGSCFSVYLPCSTAHSGIDQEGPRLVGTQ